MCMVFVYGSLKKGEALHHILERGDARYLGRAMTDEKYLLYDFGSYPAAVPSGSGTHIVGEVYEVSEELLDTLDRVEGHPHFYCRRLCTVTLEDGREIKAYIYELKEVIRSGNLLSTGEWKGDHAYLS